MTDQQARDEALTLFLAGHDSTAAGLTWTWYLMARHPAVEARLAEEIDTALAGRPPTWDDLPPRLHGSRHQGVATAVPAQLGDVPAPSGDRHRPGRLRAAERLHGARVPLRQHHDPRLVRPIRSGSTPNDSPRAARFRPAICVHSFRRRAASASATRSR